MNARTKLARWLGYALPLILLPAIATAQQTVDEALQADGGTSQGTDMIKIAAWILIFVFLIGGGIVIGLRSVMHGASDGKWTEHALPGLAFGVLLCLLPALIGYVMGIDLFDMFQINV